MIPDIVVHDADTVRFHLGEDPAEVVAIQTSAGMGEGVEDSVMSVWQMQSGATVMTHESFTHRFAGTGIEVHGTKGSIRATGVMTQRPTGHVTLITDAGEEDVPLCRPQSSTSVSVGLFTDAVAGKGAPPPTGSTGSSLSPWPAPWRRPRTSGARVAVDYGGV